MTSRRLFLAVGVAATLAGTGLWLAMRPAPPPKAIADITPAAIYAATFRDADGRSQALGQFQGQVVVLNFWATWCAPCLEEMPAFVRLQSAWAGRGVQFVGLSSEAPEKAARFGRELGINYPLWTGGEEVSVLSRRLGNALGVLPHTAVLGPDGRLLEMKVGPYTESDLNARLQNHVAKLP